MKMDTGRSRNKQRQNSSYHFLMIPDDSSQIHRVRVSGWQLRGSVLLSIGLVLALAVTAGGYMRYQGLYRKTTAIRASYAQLQKDQARLSQRLVQLESTVQRAESLASKVDSLLSPQALKNTYGIGPIKDRKRKPIGDIEKFSTLTRLDPMIFADHFSGLMENMKGRSLQVENQVVALYQKYQDRMIRLSSTPTIWPVSGWKTSSFGPRRSPFGGHAKFHDGIDIAAPWGKPVKSAGEAVVKFSGYKGGLGKTVILDHGFGIQTVYGHNSKLLVKEGDKVKGGAHIADVGNTGHSTGPHCHFEIHVDGVPVDPMNYLSPRTELSRAKAPSKNL